MADAAKSTGKLNTKGNRRGMTAAARRALARGRKTARARQTAKAREHELNGAFAVGVRGGLSGKAAKLIPDRIKAHVEALAESPGFLDVMLSGTIAADMSDANRCLEVAWSVAKDLLDKAKAGGGTEGLESATALLDVLRRWTKLPQDLAVKIEALHRMNSTGADYLADRYGGAPGAEVDDGAAEPEAEDGGVVEAEVVEGEGGLEIGGGGAPKIHVDEQVARGAEDAEALDGVDGEPSKGLHGPTSAECQDSPGGAS